MQRVLENVFLGKWTALCALIYFCSGDVLYLISDLENWTENKFRKIYVYIQRNGTGGFKYKRLKCYGNDGFSELSTVRTDD